MKLAIFDIDGTLVDSRAMITASLTAALQSEGLAVPEQARLLSIVGLSLIDAMQSLAPGEALEKHQRLASAYKDAFWRFRAENAHTETLFDGAREMLDRLRRRGDVLLGIATGKSRRGIDHLVERHGFHGWFATVQTSDTHPSKPHPSMVVQALAETGVEPRQAVVIGDTSFDMEMARAAGAWAVGVTWGNHPRDHLEFSGAHHIVNNFKALDDTLELLWEVRPQ